MGLRSASEPPPQCDGRRAPLAWVGVVLVATLATLLYAPPAGAASGTWERAWGKNVSGGGVFGVCTVAASCQAGTTGGLGGEMQTPYGVAIDSSGNVYVVEINNNRIQKFDSSGTWLRAWGKNVNGGGVFGVCTVAASCQAGFTGGLGGEMNTPAAVATDSSGNVYVADESNQRIQKFDSSGTWLRAWGKNVNGGGVFGVCTVAASCQAGTTGGLGGEMNFPDAVAVDASDNVYVADSGNNRIQKFDSSGTWLRAWGKNVNGGGVFGVCTVAASCQGGTTGGLGGEMSSAFGIATDASSNVYVADGGNQRIQKFDSSGTWLRAWGKNVNGGGVFGVCTVAASCMAGSIGALGGEMFQPVGVGTDASANVYVGDSNNYRIQEFDSSGTWLRAWGKNVNGGDVFGVCTVVASCQRGTTGGLGGEMVSPFGVAIDATGKLYVADTSNNRIQKFDPSKPTISSSATSVIIGASIADQATLSGGSSPGGTITFTAYGSDDANCGNPPAYTSDPVTVSGNGNYDNSPTFTPGTPGTYRWRASYSGDVNNAAVSTPCNDSNESSVVAQVTPTISTQATANTPIGGQISDQATLSGGGGPTGTITFTAYGPDDDTCGNPPAYTSSAVAVSGNGEYDSSLTFTPATAGTYRWIASYSGDTNNAAVATTCDDPNETSIVAQATPAMVTQATASAAVTTQISDQATLTGGSTPTGTITLTAYGPNNTTCANPPAYTSSAVVVAGNGSYVNSPAFAPGSLGTYRWRASYSGDANNAVVATPCNDANEATQVVIATPTISTLATANATLGGQISDQATISGGGAPTGTITFTAYGPDAANCGNPPAYTSDPISISGNHNYVNSPAFIPATAGTYRWMISYSGDTNNAAVSTACNDSGETSMVAGLTTPPILPTSPVLPTSQANNAFAIGKLRGKALTVNVSSRGVVQVTDAGTTARRAFASATRLLNPSTVSGGPGAIKVTLKLTKLANQMLKQKGKVTARARITFTPNGGTANSQTTKLKIKKR